MKSLPEAYGLVKTTTGTMQFVAQDHFCRGWLGHRTGHTIQSPRIGERLRLDINPSARTGV
jgi:hypothetical protein